MAERAGVGETVQLVHRGDEGGGDGDEVRDLEPASTLEEEGVASLRSARADHLDDARGDADVVETLADVDDVVGVGEVGELDARGGGGGGVRGVAPKGHDADVQRAGGRAGGEDAVHEGDASGVGQLELHGGRGKEHAVPKGEDGERGRERRLRG